LGLWGNKQQAGTRQTRRKGEREAMQNQMDSVRHARKGGRWFDEYHKGTRAWKRAKRGSEEKVPCGANQTPEEEGPIVGRA